MIATGECAGAALPLLAHRKVGLALPNLADRAERRGRAVTLDAPHQRDASATISTFALPPISAVAMRSPSATRRP